MTAEDAILRRIRTRSFVIAGAGASLAFLFGWRSAVSLTICAAAVIFSFLVFERLTGRLTSPRERTGMRRSLPLLLVTAAAILLLLVAFHWKGFDPVAGVVGLSAVVLAIGAELFERSEES